MPDSNRSQCNINNRTLNLFDQKMNVMGENNPDIEFHFNSEFKTERNESNTYLPYGK
jgi:hypothetical protein